MSGLYPDPDRARRIGPLDLGLLALLALAVWYVWSRVADVLVYRWDWSFLPDLFVRVNPQTGGLEANLLLEGLFTTIRLSLWAMLFASLLGVVLGILATRNRLLARLLAKSYVGLIRNIPPLVFIFVFYFFVSAQLMPLLGLDSWSRDMSGSSARLVSLLIGPPALLENLVSGVICLAMFEAAYIAEIVRAGILSVPRAQTEAADSLGLKPWQTFRLVVIPQALRAVLPPLANQFILLVKNSAIVSLISVQELTFTGTEIAISTGRRFETWIVVAVLYFALCYGLALLFRHLERRSRQHQR